MRTYSDIDLNFTPHPVTKDITPKYDAEAIKGSIRNIIHTMNGERPFQTELGSRLMHLIFEPITPVIHGIIQQEVLNAIASYEPRVSIMNVIVNYYPEANTVEIIVVFAINGSSIPHSLNVVLERTR